jgi:hypothetical protein
VDDAMTWIDPEALEMSPGCLPLFLLFFAAVMPKKQ